MELRRDQRFPPPHAMDDVGHPPQWRPMTDDRSSRFRSDSNPVLPRISSLLKGKRKLPREEPPAPVVMYVPQNDEQLRRPSHYRARDWDHDTPASELRRVPPPPMVERRRLFYQHSVDPHKIHEIQIPAEVPFIPPYHAELPRKLVRPTRPAFYEDEAAPKRRRVAPPPPLYEAEYGLTVLETTTPLMRFPPSTEPAPGRRYVRSDLETGHARVITDRRISYNRRERIHSSALPAKAETRELSPLTTLKSKAFLKSKSLVRNRHDEIDWVATFLNVGFDSSSIYALVCPLRKGRWKSEEENYTMGLLKLIENGTILLRHGQSIRGYIGEKLHSDDMRVLKKLSNYKMFHFAKLINPRLAEEDKLDMKVEGAEEGLQQLDQLKGEFLRSVQLEALVAVRKYLSNSSLRDLLNVRA